MLIVLLTLGLVLFIIAYGMAVTIYDLVLMMQARHKHA